MAAQEISAELVEVDVKKSDPYPNLWCLVFIGQQIIVLRPPGGNTWSDTNHRMFVGTSTEVRDVINRLGLVMP